MDWPTPIARRAGFGWPQRSPVRCSRLGGWKRKDLDRPIIASTRRSIEGRHDGDRMAIPVFGGSSSAPTATSPNHARITTIAIVIQVAFRVFMTATLRRWRRRHQIFTVCNPQSASRSAPARRRATSDVGRSHLEVS